MASFLCFEWNRFSMSSSEMYKQKFCTCIMKIFVFFFIPSKRWVSGYFPYHMLKKEQQKHCKLTSPASPVVIQNTVAITDYDFQFWIALEVSYLHSWLMHTKCNQVPNPYSRNISSSDRLLNSPNAEFFLTVAFSVYSWLGVPTLKRFYWLHYVSGVNGLSL